MLCVSVRVQSQGHQEEEGQHSGVSGWRQNTAAQKEETGKWGRLTPFNVTCSLVCRQYASIVDVRVNCKYLIVNIFGLPT